MDKLHAGAALKGVERVGGRTRFSMIASTSAIDRDNEIIDVAGWEWSTPLPKLYYGHGPYNDPTKHIGRLTDIRIEDGKLIVDGEISDDLPEHHIARLVGQQMRAGDLDQGSVGFMPKAFEDLDPTKSGGATRRFTKQELLEFSLVGVPSQMESNLIAFRSLMPDAFVAKAVITWSSTGTGGDVIQSDSEAKTTVIDTRTPLMKWFAGDDLRPEVKAGAVLSRANHDRLTSAREAMAQAVLAIDDTLASATRAEEDAQEGH